MAYTIAASDPAELAALDAGSPAFLAENLIAPPSAAANPRWTANGNQTDPDITDPNFPLTAVYDWNHFYFSRSNNTADLEQFINGQMSPSNVDTIFFRVEPPDTASTFTVRLEIASDAAFTTDLEVLLAATAVTGPFRFELSGSVVYQNLEFIRLVSTRSSAGPPLSVSEFTAGKRVVLDHRTLAPFETKPAAFLARRNLSPSRGFAQQIYASDLVDTNISYNFCADELPKLQSLRAAVRSSSRALFARLSPDTGWSLGRFDGMDFIRTGYSMHGWSARFREQVPSRSQDLVLSPATGSNIVDEFSWDIAYECQNAGTSWVPVPSGATLTSISSITTGLPTTGWENLPLRFISRGMSPGTTEFTTGSFDWVSSNFHWRGILDLSSGVVNGDHILRYVVTGFQLAEIRIVSETNVNFVVRNDSSGGVYTGIFSGGSAPSGRLLIDWGMVGAQMFLFVNGVDYSPPANPSPVLFHNGPDSMTVLGPSVAEGTYVFLGWRWDQFISFDTHRENAARAIP